MKRENRRYLKLSIFALLLLSSSFFHYQNNQKKVESKFDRIKQSEQLKIKESDEIIVESSVMEMSETSTEESAGMESSEELVTVSTNSPQTMTEPMSVNGIVIVNKRYPLPETYNPGENSEAAAAFQKMNEEMRQLGLNISTEYSGYRSYAEQAELYESYVDSDGQSNAEQYSSRPGYSEHQTGLAFDFIDQAGELVQTQVEADWIAENAHRYGFIVRYKEGQEEITGYMAEAWHVRYVGQEAAAEMKENNLTLEEYLDVEGGDYNGGR